MTPESRAKPPLFAGSNILLRLMGNVFREVPEFHEIARSKFFQKKLFLSEATSEPSLVLVLTYLQDFSKEVTGMDEVVMDSILSSLRKEQTTPPVSQVIVNLLAHNFPEEAL